MSKTNAFQLSRQAAELYDRQRVPAIFGPMAEAVLDEVDLPGGAAILDVACGTGVVARAVAGRLERPSRIVGCDLSPEMIAVASVKPGIGAHRFEWRAAPADNMPFADGTFELAFCQQGLQFFDDRPAALVEMHRVLRPGGRLVLTCWGEVPPFFRSASDALGRHLSVEAARKAVAPFAWTDAAEIGGLIAQAGFECPPPRGLSVVRRMHANVQAIRADLLSTPNEAALREAGDEVIDRIAAEILASVDRFRKGDMLQMPQATLLFDAVAV